MTSQNPILDVLSAPLDPDWTIEKVAEKVLSAIANLRPEQSQEFVVDESTAIEQLRRLFRPLLACLAVKFATEAGAPANLHGGAFAFQRPGRSGVAWVVGHFDNRPGRVRLALRRSNSPESSPAVAMAEVASAPAR